MDPVFGTIAFLAIVALIFFGLIRAPIVMRFVAHLTVTPQALQKVRRAIEDACRDFDTGQMAPEDAEGHLNELARHAIGRTLAEINPRRPIEVNKSWPPDQRVIITGDIAVIAPNIGWLILGPQDRIEPITVRIKRQGVVKLDTRRPIAEAFQEPYTPPAKVATAKAAPPAKPSPAPAKAPEKPVSAHVQKQRKLP